MFRRMHKKGAVSEIKRRRARKVQRVERSIVGLELDELRNRRVDVPKRKLTTAEQAALSEKRDKTKVRAPRATAGFRRKEKTVSRADTSSHR
jgi:hypothetical protein